MKKFLIHCPDEESREDARAFYRKMFEGTIERDTALDLVSKLGISIYFIVESNDAAFSCYMCGQRITDFLTISNKRENKRYGDLCISTLD